MYAPGPIAPDASPTSHCAPIWALHNVEHTARSTLYATCTARAPHSDLHETLWRIGSQPGWQAAAVARLLAPVRREPNPTRDLSRQLTTAMARAPRSKSVCRGLQQRLHDYMLHNGDGAAPPLSRRTLQEDDARCLGLDPRAFAETAIISAKVPADATISALVTSHLGSSLLEVSGTDLLDLEGKTLFVLPVPHGSAVSLSLGSRSLEVPRYWHGIATHDKTVWDDTSLSCATMSVHLDPNSLLLIDGIELARGANGTEVSRNVLLSTSEDHEAIVLTCEGDGICAPLLRRTLSAESLTGTSSVCNEVVMDARKGRGVGVILMPPPPSCSVDDTRNSWLYTDPLRMVQAWLDRNGLQSVDPDALAQFRGRLQTFQRDLDITMLTPREAERPREAARHAAQAFSDISQDIWSQGVESLLFVQVSCRADATGSALTHDVYMSLVSLPRQTSADRLGLFNFNVGYEHEVVGSPDEREKAIGVVLGRLFNRSSYGIVGPPGWQHGWGRRNAKYRVFATTGAVTTETETPGILVRRHSFSDRGSCGKISGPSFDIQHAHTTRGKFARVTFVRDYFRQISPSSPDGSTEIDLEGLGAGTYSIYAGTRRGQQFTPETAICVDSTPTHEGWVQIMGTVSTSLATEKIDMAGFTVLAGHLWALGRGRCRDGNRAVCWLPLGLGLGGGYSLQSSKTQLSEAPGWSDLKVTEDEVLLWQRHSLVLFPHIELRMRRPAADLWLRAGPMASIGVVDMRKIPVSFKEFRSYSPLLDPDLGWMAQFGVTAYTRTRVGITPTIALSMPDINPKRQERGSPYDNRSLSVSVGFGIAWKTGGR